MDQQQDCHSQQKSRGVIGFDKYTVQILKDETLGIGCFGRVCKAKCGDLTCAAKILHPTLFDPSAQHRIAHRKECIVPIRRFEQECEFLSAIKHPNIVQYLMLHHDPDTGLPVLMMELMDCSLTDFLESSTQSSPYHVQVNLCHDVVLALSFLHSNDILHRDLSGNNVLLIGNVRAKVTDFGMAKLSDLNHRTNRLTLTMCPGTDVYMPPETMDDHPKYTEKIDCFSFGVIVVQILTRKFPRPGDRNKTIEINHPQIPNGTTIKVAVPEVERRQSQINEIAPNHPLLPIAISCLKDKDTERPSAEQLCKMVGSLKDSSEYRESMRAIQDSASVSPPSQNNSWKDHGNRKEVEELQKQLTSKNETIAAEKQENQQLRELLEQSEREKCELVEELKLLPQLVAQNDIDASQLTEEVRHLALKFQLIVAQNNTDASHQDAVKHLADNVGQYTGVNSLTEWKPLSESLLLLARSEKSSNPEPPPSHSTTTSSSTNNDRCDSNKVNSAKEDCTRIELTWRRGEKPPCEMYSSCNAVGDGDFVYVRPGGLTLSKDQDGRLTYVYNVKHDVWSQLPNCPHRSCSIAMVNGSLTAIGGYYMYDSGGRVAVGYRRIDTNKLLIFSKAKNSWINSDLPPMPTKRSDSTALSTASLLIVVGGQAGLADSNATLPLNAVEVMNIDTRTWSTAAHLPPKLVRHSISATICGESIYLFGVQSIFTCTLGDLLNSCRDQGAESEKKVDTVWNTFKPDVDTVWNTFTDLPVTESTCVSIHGRLLAIGGMRGEYRTTAVFMYRPDTNSWEHISNHMTAPRMSCLAAALHTKSQVVVVGGNIGESSVEIATVTTKQVNY